MGIVKGGALRLIQTALYFLAFCCGAVILGFYSYFLSVLADRNVHISKQDKAVEGISGVGVLYTIFAVVLTCCLSGVTFFSLIGLVFDVLLLGGFVAIAVLTRHSIHSCHGFLNTPIGSGPANVGLGFDKSFSNSNNDIVYSVTFRTACLFNKACFAVSIIGAFIFLCTALMQLVLIRHHKKDKRYGPGPSNNYTSGSGKRSLFSRKRNNKDAEYAAGGLGVGAPDTRPSHETGYTGTTVGGVGGIHDDKLNTPGNAHYSQGTATNY